MPRLCCGSENLPLHEDVSRLLRVAWSINNNNTSGSELWFSGFFKHFPVNKREQKKTPHTRNSSSFKHPTVGNHLQWATVGRKTIKTYTNLFTFRIEILLLVRVRRKHTSVSSCSFSWFSPDDLINLGSLPAPGFNQTHQSASQSV